jgi:hypothetical protein
MKKAEILNALENGTEGLELAQYDTVDRISGKINEAWNNWDDETTKPFWEGAETKPESETYSFI